MAWHAHVALCAAPGRDGLCPPAAYACRCSRGSVRAFRQTYLPRGGGVRVRYGCVRGANADPLCRCPRLLCPLPCSNIIQTDYAATTLATLVGLPENMAQSQTFGQNARVPGMVLPWRSVVM